MTWQEDIEEEGQELLEMYRKEVRRLYGDEIADATVLTCDHGWYRVNLAWRWRDGTLRINHYPMNCRRFEIAAMIRNLRRRTEIKERET